MSISDASLQLAGLKGVDALFLGGATLEDAGYYSLSKRPKGTSPRPGEIKQPEPGWLHYMTVCLPFKRIYTHGDCGIVEEAVDRVNKESGPDIVRLAEKELDNIEYLPDWRDLMVRETAPVYNEYFPRRLLIASVDNEYDSAALDELLWDCKNNNPDFQAFLFKKEPLGKEIIRKHGVRRLDATWDDYLDSLEFLEYYRKGLRRLFTEYSRWNKEQAVTREIKGAQKQVILKTMTWIGKPVPRMVICSSIGMAPALEELMEKGLVIYNKETGNIEPVYGFEKKSTGKIDAVPDRTEQKAIGREVRTLWRMGTIAPRDTARAMDFFSIGHILCREAGQWDDWKDALLKMPLSCSFTAGAKAWLISHEGQRRTWIDSKKWAGFGMLYTLYFLRGELNAAADLGYIASVEREYRRLFSYIDDLYRIMRNASYEQIEPGQPGTPSEGIEPVTEKAVDSLVGGFSVTWDDMPQYFPWEQLTPDEQNSALTKLLFLVEKLKNILSRIVENKAGVFHELKTFAEDELSIPVSFMKRLAEYVDELEKPEPIPWYAAGEILEIKEKTLLVTIERSGEEDQQREIPKKDFPEENPRIGQNFFAKIDEDQPDIVYDIEPLPFEETTFDEIFIELFGKDVFDKVRANWEKEE